MHKLYTSNFIVNLMSWGVEGRGGEGRGGEEGRKEGERAREEREQRETEVRVEGVVRKAGDSKLRKSVGNTN